MKTLRWRWISLLSCTALVLWIVHGIAQQSASPDYLRADLRASVNALKAEAATQKTTPDNLRERLDVVWPWINAYSLTGAPLPVNATLQVSSAYRALEERRLEGTTPPAGVLRTIDDMIYEFTVKDEQPDALGAVAVDVDEPVRAGSWATVGQTYTVGSAELGPGTRIMAGKQLQLDGGSPQNEDPEAPHYVSASSSNPNVRIDPTTSPLSGMHGGFRGARPMPAFEVKTGTLKTGDTVTLVYGDRSAGSEGWQQQTFATDQCIPPIYIDIDGSGRYLTPRWASYEVVGGPAVGVSAVVPSIVEPGEEFSLSIRWEDVHGNRPSGTVPEAKVTVNGQPHSTVEGGEGAIRLVESIQFDREGIYRFGVSSADGKIETESNPVWVREDPPYRLHWGETHTHTGMAEGQGTMDRSYRFAREDARLDFLGLSEHEIWLDDFEWRAMSRAAETNTVPGEFVAFLGYEWTARRAWGGHHNVFYRAPTGDRVGTQIAPSLTLLYQGLRKRFATKDVLIIPHAHQAGDWRTNDPEMETMVEIMSMHGTFEWFGNYYLRQGHQVGFLAASDDHRTRPGYSWTSSRQPASSLSQFGGLVGVRSGEKTADSIFDALKTRDAYAVTDAQRIILDTELNGTGMGERIPYTDERRLVARVIGTSPIRRMAVVKNGEIVYAKRPLKTTLSSDASLVVGFESSSEPFFRDNPRGYRQWVGTITVENAKLVGLHNLHFDNNHKEWLEADGNTVRFSAGSRGQAETIQLDLEGASPSTKLTFAIEPGQEWGKSPVPIRPLKKLPAENFSIALNQLKDGYVKHDVSHGMDRDEVTLELVGGSTATEADIEFTDTGDMQHGDYYYVRVDQLDGARAYSSPTWVGGEPRR